MIEVIDAKIGKYIHAVVATGGLKKGALVKWVTNEAVACDEGVSTAIVLGVSKEDYDAGEVADIIPIDGKELEMDIYQGGGTDTFVAADVGKFFDIYVDGTTKECFIDPNDVTGAMFMVVSYDNARQKARVRITRALLLL